MRSARRLSELARRRVLIWLGVLFVAILALCWLLVVIAGALPGDAASAAKVREERFGAVVLAPAHALDWLGQPLAGALTAVLLGAYVGRLVGWRGAVLVLSAEGVLAITWLIKLAVGRSRPAGAEVPGPSFPSGHTAWAMALFGLVAIIAARHRSWPAAVCCLLVAAAMGPSRVLLGVHWLSDVIAGYAVGMAWLVAVILIGSRWMRNRSLR